MKQHLNEWTLDQKRYGGSMDKKTQKQLVFLGAASQSKEELPCFPICQMMLK